MIAQKSSKKPYRERKPGETVFIGILLFASFFIAYQAFAIAGFSSISSPGSVPMLASIFLLVSAASISLNTFRMQSAPGQRFLTEITPPLMLVYGLLVLGYVLIIDLAGFVLSSVLFLFLSTFYLHRKGVLTSLLISVNALAVIYIVFRLIFKVVLPEGSLIE